MKDTILYDKLEISPNLSEDEIKKIGKKLLLKHHPDKNENKEEASKKFIEVKEILDILTDKERRDLYHKIGVSILDNSNPNNFSSNNPNINPFNNFNPEILNAFNSFFNNFTKMSGNQNGFFPGMMPGMIPGMMPGMPPEMIRPGMSTFNNRNYNSDIVYTIKINRRFLRDEQEYNINYKRIIVCDECDKDICQKCNNKRFTENKIILNNMSNMTLIQQIPCDLCKDNKCKKCNNNQYIEEEKKVILNIKKDKLEELIDNKQTIILKENGNILKERKTDLIIIFTE